jgi:uncharacterized membrane protein
MNKPWQIWMVLIAIFAAGALSGGLVVRHVVRRQAPPPEGWVAREIASVAKAVNLTAEQNERIRPIVKANFDDLIKLRREAFEVIDRMGKQITAELTPEQRMRYERILREHSEVRREAQEQRNAMRHGDGPPPGEGGPPPPPPKIPGS